MCLRACRGRQFRVITDELLFVFSIHGCSAETEIVFFFPFPTIIELLNNSAGINPSSIPWFYEPLTCRCAAADPPRTLPTVQPRPAHLLTPSAPNGISGLAERPICSQPVKFAFWVHTGERAPSIKRGPGARAGEQTGVKTSSQLLSPAAARRVPPQRVINRGGKSGETRHPPLPLTRLFLANH